MMKIPTWRTRFWHVGPLLYSIAVCNFNMIMKNVVTMNRLVIHKHSSIDFCWSFPIPPLPWFRSHVHPRRPRVINTGVWGRGLTRWTELKANQLFIYGRMIQALSAKVPSTFIDSAEVGLASPKSPAIFQFLDSPSLSHLWSV